MGEEAATVMYKFSDQIEAMNEALDTERKDGAREQMEEDAKGMYEEGLSPEVIARIQKVSVETVMEILDLQPA